MKLMLLITLILTYGCNGASDKNAPSDPDKDPQAVKADSVKSAALKEEDCDDKAKKPIEIKEDTISLNGDTGCSLDEAKPSL
jgi:hypothetical protein